MQPAPVTFLATKHKGVTSAGEGKAGKSSPLAKDKEQTVGFLCAGSSHGALSNVMAFEATASCGMRLPTKWYLSLGRLIHRPTHIQLAS